MVFLDIDRIPELMRVSGFAGYNQWNWASFDDRDHFGDPARPLRQRLVEDAARSGIALPDGPVFLLTHLRYLGYNFNPISLFYCYDKAGELQTVLAEVNSTFGETRNYWLSTANQLASQNARHYRCAKTMHVSPFMPMELDYEFILTPPADRLVAHMNTLDRGSVNFDATLTLDRQPWSARSLHRALHFAPVDDGESNYRDPLAGVAIVSAQSTGFHASCTGDIEMIVDQFAQAAFLRAMSAIREGRLELFCDGQRHQFGDRDSSLCAILGYPQLPLLPARAAAGRYRNRRILDGWRLDVT